MGKTRSIAIPATCLAETACRTQQQASHIVHQIGRIALHYKIDEIIVYDCEDEQKAQQAEKKTDQPKKIVFDDVDDKKDVEEEEEKLGSDDAVRLAKLLQFFITPSYLRESTFDNLKAFQYAKKLPKLPNLPYMNHKSSRYLEGITIPGKVAGVKKYKKGQQRSKKQIALESVTKYVSVGAGKAIELSKAVPVNARVTVDVEHKTVVSPQQAYNGAYFGYAVRIAKSFGKVFTECVHKEGYSYTAYVPCAQFTGGELKCDIAAVSAADLGARSDRVLYVLGKWSHIEQAVKNDSEELKQVDDAKVVFDGMLGGANAELRIEDALTIALAKIDGI